VIAVSISLGGDRGRLVVLPFAAGMAVVAGASLLRGSADRGGTGAPVLLHWLTVLLTCAFYLLVGWCYLRRGRAVATSTSVPAHVVAVAATLTPFGYAALPAADPGVARSLAASLLLVAGTAWSVWALRSLGRSLAILAQARAVVERGPYRWIRHPLYLGEVVSCLGLALNCRTAAAAVLWLALCAMQVYRATREEQVLSRSLPDYPAYRARTSALLPGGNALGRTWRRTAALATAGTSPAQHGSAGVESGATAVEYCLLVTLIAVPIISFVSLLGSQVVGLFSVVLPGL